MAKGFEWQQRFTSGIMRNLVQRMINSKCHEKMAAFVQQCHNMSLLSHSSGTSPGQSLLELSYLHTTGMSGSNLIADCSVQDVGKVTSAPLMCFSMIKQQQSVVQGCHRNRQACTDCRLWSISSKLSLHCQSCKVNTQVKHALKSILCYPVFMTR